MTIDFTFRPIDNWPGQLKASRRTSQFKTSYDKTLRELDTELSHLRAKRVVIQLAISEYDVRNDGLPRSDMRMPKHPGVIISFENKHGTFSYPCDTYTTWKDNLRAIVKALEALRAVDRYGVTTTGEQYKGWLKLPSPEEGVEKAKSVFRRFTDIEIRTAYDLRKAFEAAAFKAHPDRGGSHVDIQEVLAARDVLKPHLVEAV